VAGSERNDRFGGEVRLGWGRQGEVGERGRKKRNWRGGVEREVSGKGGGDQEGEEGWGEGRSIEGEGYSGGEGEGKKGGSR